MTKNSKINNPIEQEPKKELEGLKITVAITETDIFKTILTVMKFLLRNVKADIRNEAINKLKNGGVSAKYKLFEG